ncbi:ATP-binding protein [Streptomyces sp. NPDC101062]|uniref:ATP-binding protein n=1 Tax=unclassified Streptomyces TaxID=2593676 RepID=UPI00380AAFF2
MMPRCFEWTAFPGTTRTVQAARAFFRETSTRWSVPRPAADDIVQIGSELAANAVEHGMGEIGAGLILADGSLVLTVTDHGSLPDVGLRADRPGDDAVRGRGLYLVRALAAGWGWYRTPAGTAVWAMVTLPSDAAPAMHAQLGTEGCR